MNNNYIFDYFNHRPNLRMNEGGIRMRIMTLEFFILPLSLFILSMLGISINRSNIIMILLCFEMMLLSIIVSLLYGSFFLDNNIGQLGSIFIMTMAAIESAIGLSIMIVFSKIKGSVTIRFLNLLKG